MRFTSHLQHTLVNLRHLNDLYNKPGKTDREEMFIASQLTSQGLVEAGDYIHRLRSRVANKNADDFLAFLLAQYQTIQSFDGLKTNLGRQDLVSAAYGLDGYLFEKGDRFPDKLLVVFTTMYNNYYVSNLVLLTFLRQFGVSILVLKDASLFNYLNGVDRLGTDLEQVSVAIQRLADEHHVNEIYITGFSSGGYASLLLSTLVPCDGYLGFSIRTDLSAESPLRPGKFFTPAVRAQIPTGWLLDLAAVIAAHGRPVRRKLIYGSASTIDCEHALHLSAVDGLGLEVIEGCGHVTVAAMLVGNRLEPEFRSLLFEA